MPLSPAKLAVYDSDPSPLVVQLVGRGHTVVVAADESQLQAIASRERPDLLVGDLAGWSGLGTSRSTPAGVCQRLKSHLLLRHLPVVVVSGNGDLEQRVAAIRNGADDYLVKPYAAEELFARVDRAIARTCESLDANPLTRLPGNASIKAEINGRLARGEIFAVLFTDLDNFKAFNDRYGFDRGDEALRVMGDILLKAIEESGNGPTVDFAGNIGGDDFVAITSVDRAEPMARRICQLVDQRFPLLCDEADRRAGYITGVDRQGRRCHFALMTVSVAVVTNEDHPIRHHSEFSQIGTEIKQYLKHHSGHRYMRNRRRRLDPLLLLAAVNATPADGLAVRGRS